MARLNYKHLRYFWTVAKAGGIARACERLHLTPQTISGQLSAFEDALGHKLFARAGRRLELTEAGRMVLSYADEMFTVGEELEEALRHKAGSLPLLFKVGIADSVPKSVAYRLLEPAVSLAEPLRMVCREGKLAGLMADLAIHRLDLVIADGPMPASMSIRGFNHLLGECGLTFLAAPALAQRHRARFPRCLDGAPLLLPGEEAAVRPRLMQWIESIGVRPIIVGEFDDGALTEAFGKAGIGIFAVPSAIAEEVRPQYRVKSLGRTDAVTERFYAISVERRLTHPAVVAISSAARTQLFRKRRGA
ncbi:MAG TPA: transcriptional activator NhaR [Burkholderiales bacterium]|nr:transcriptional activator NhaR [Burkholderiales bacterium]